MAVAYHLLSLALETKGSCTVQYMSTLGVLPSREERWAVSADACDGALWCGGEWHGAARSRCLRACVRVWACGRVGVWACGRVGVWACGRVRVCACARACKGIRSMGPYSVVYTIRVLEQRTQTLNPKP